MTTSNLPALIEGLAAAPQPGPWTEFTRAQQVAFLEALATSGSVRAAARSVNVGPSTVYRARRGDPAFRTAWAGALIAARVIGEDTLATRAIDGIVEDVMYRGEVVATRTRYSDRLLLAHLGRLDKLTEDARASAFAADFEGALARFAAGEVEPNPHAPPPAPAPVSAPAESSPPGQCAKCAKSYSPHREEELEECPITGEMLPPEECIRNIMENERPAGAKKPHEFMTRHSAAAIADEQFEAFDACVKRWWLVLPPGPGDDPEEWTFAEED